MAALVFPVALWLASTLFYFGALGPYSDDYALNLRGPASDTYDWSSPRHPWQQYDYFYRPLHLGFTHLMGTVFWERWWVNRLAGALAHGLCALLLFLTLRRLGICRRAAVAGALLVIVFPLSAEVLFWFGAISLPLGCAVFFATVELVRRHAAAGRGGWWLLGPMFVLAFLVPCWYEQPAAGLAAVPLLHLAARPAGQRARDWLPRGLAAAGACGAACVLYVGLLVATAPAWARGSGASFVPLERAPERAERVARLIGETLIGVRGRQMLAGSFLQGSETLSRGAGLLWAGVLLGSMAAFLAGWWARQRADGREPGSTRPRRGAIASAGVAMMVLGWLPVAAVESNSIEPRHFYFPILGAAIALSAGLDNVATRLAGRGARAGRLVAGLVLGAAALAGAACMVGFQTLAVRRERADLAAVSRLKELVPAPSPGTVFIPLAVRAEIAAPPLRRYVNSVESAFAQPWSSPHFVRAHYRRDDIAATFFSPWSGITVRDLTAQGARYIDALPGSFPAHPRGGTALSWDRMVPFVVERDNSVALVGRLWVERENGEDLEIRPPLVGALAREAGVPVRAFAVRDASEEVGETLPPWRWPTGRSAEPVTRRAWGVDRKAFELRLDRSEWAKLRAALGAGPARQVVFRVSLPPGTRADGGRVRLDWKLTGGGGDRDLARIELGPAMQRREERWLPVVVDLPPTVAGQRLEIVAAALSPADLPVRVWVSPGSVVPTGTGPTPPDAGSR